MKYACTTPTPTPRSLPLYPPLLCLLEEVTGSGAVTDLDDELTLNKSLNDTEEQYSYCKKRVDAAAEGTV